MLKRLAIELRVLSPAAFPTFSHEFSCELAYGLFHPKLESMLVGTVERQSENALSFISLLSSLKKLALLWYARYVACMTVFINGVCWV